MLFDPEMSLSQQSARNTMAKGSVRTSAQTYANMHGVSGRIMHENSTFIGRVTENGRNQTKFLLEE